MDLGIPFPYLDLRSDAERQAEQAKAEQIQMSLSAQKRSEAQMALQGAYSNYSDQELADQVRQGTPFGQKVVGWTKMAMGLNPDDPLPTRRTMQPGQPDESLAMAGESPQPTYSDTPVIWRPNTMRAAEQLRGVNDPMAQYGVLLQNGLLNSKDGHVVLPGTPQITGQAHNQLYNSQALNNLAMAGLHDDQRTKLIPAQVNNYNALSTQHLAGAEAAKALARQRGLMEVAPGASVYGVGDLQGGAGTPGVVPTPRAIAPDRANVSRWSSPQQGIGPNGEPIYFQVGPNGEKRDIPGVTPMPKQGMSIEFGADGRPLSITTGGAGKQNQAGLGPATVTKVEKDILEANESLVRVDNIIKQYQDDYQRIGPKLGFWGNAAKDKLGVGLSQQQQQDLGDYTQARANAYELLNNELNRLSGAAVTEHEMNRLKQSLPNPGAGVFDGDSPVEFNAKTERLRQNLTLAKARLSLVRKGGLKSIEQMPLSNMDQVIQQRGNSLEKELKAKNPSASQQDVEAKVKEMLKQEYGL